MAFKDYLPFQQAPGLQKRTKKQAQILPLDDQKTVAKTFKVAALALGFQNLPDHINTRSTFEPPPYDFDRIIQAIDTDSYTKQAFSKYKELFWKEGWEIISENPKTVAYIWQRIDFMEVAMQKPFAEFLVEVVDQLIKFSNVFIVKSRGDLQPFFPGKLYPPENRDPILGYYIIPTEQVEILRDRYNKPRWYRQRVSESSAATTMGTSDRRPQWNAKDVIHLSIDKRPGRAYGTPFIISAMDDIIALRQIEEDIQNLVHRELFPLYKYQVGTDDHPADDDELERAAMEIESIRTEGALVIPHRHDVDVIGAENTALDASEYLKHFKERVAVGLGLYPHHLGMDNGGNRAATDRLDTALYDKIKLYQRYVAEAIRLFIFNELLIEGGFDPFVNPITEDIADRCLFRFNEIDVDTQVKKETHEIGKATANLQTVGETRLKLNNTAHQDEEDTLAALQARMTPDNPVQTKNKDGSPGAPKLVDTTPRSAQKDAQKSSSGGAPNPRNLKKGPGNIIRPANQHGRRTSPNIRRDDIDDNWIQETVELLGEDFSE